MASIQPFLTEKPVVVKATESVQEQKAEPSVVQTEERPIPEEKPVTQGAGEVISKNAVDALKAMISPQVTFRKESPVIEAADTSAPPTEASMAETINSTPYEVDPNVNFVMESVVLADGQTTLNLQLADNLSEGFRNDIITSAQQVPVFIGQAINERGTEIRVGRIGAESVSEVPDANDIGFSFFPSDNRIVINEFSTVPDQFGNPSLDLDGNPSLIRTVLGDNVSDRIRAHFTEEIAHSIGDLTYNEFFDGDILTFALDQSDQFFNAYESDVANLSNLNLPPEVQQELSYYVDFDENGNIVTDFDYEGDSLGVTELFANLLTLELTGLPSSTGAAYLPQLFPNSAALVSELGTEEGLRRVRENGFSPREITQSVNQETITSVQQQIAGIAPPPAEVPDPSNDRPLVEQSEFFEDLVRETYYPDIDNTNPDAVIDMIINLRNSNELSPEFSVGLILAITEGKVSPESAAFYAAVTAYDTAVSNLENLDEFGTQLDFNFENVGNTISIRTMTPIDEYFGGSLPDNFLSLNGIENLQFADGPIPTLDINFDQNFGDPFNLDFGPWDDSILVGGSLF